MSDEYAPKFPDDWRPPHRVLMDRKWRRHPQHDRLTKLAGERAPSGEPSWELSQEPERHDHDWTVVWFRAIDPRDDRPAIRICRFPNEWLKSEQPRVDDMRALEAEHELD